MSLFHKYESVRITVAFLALVICAVSAGLAMPTSEECTFAHSLESGEPWNWNIEGPGAAELVAVEVPAAGWLAVELASSIGASGSNWLQVVGAECAGLEDPAGAAGFLDRGLLQVQEPGTLYLRFGAVHEQPSGASRSLRLSTHHIGPKRGEEKDGEPGDDTEEEDGEIVPFLYSGNQCGGSPWPIQASGLLDRGVFRKDGDPGDDTEEEDGEIVPVLGASPTCVLPCAGLEPANDLLYCAGHLEPGVEIAGRFESLDGLDRDYFSFDVQTTGAVLVSAESDLGLQASLLDVSGRVLASEELRGGRPLAATLTPGRYYLRVEGFGEGEYRLELGGHDFASF